MTTTPAMTTAQPIGPTRLKLSAGPDERREITLQISGRLQFWDLARALAAWAADERLDVRNLPQRPGEQWALTRIRAIVWKLGLDRISHWPHQVDAQQAALPVRAYNAAWLLWGEPFEIPNTELDAAQASYPTPNTKIPGADRPRPNPCSEALRPTGGALLVSRERALS